MSGWVICSLISFAAAGAALAIVASDSHASSYSVVQCTNDQGSVSDAESEGAGGYNLENGCGPDNGHLNVRSGSAVGGGLFNQYSFTAPAGTRMTRVTGNFGIFSASDPQGNQSYFFRRYASGGGDQTTSVSLNSDADFTSSFDTANPATGGGSAIDRVGVGVICNRSAGATCPSRDGISARLGNLTFYMQDTVAPGPPQTSGSVLAGWVSGTKIVNFEVADIGSGVSLAATQVNGTIVDFDGLCTADLTRLRPCPINGSGSTSFDVAQSPFRQGNNTLLVCVQDYGDNPQTVCKNDNVQVDTIAPGAPSGLSLAAGEGWRRDRDDFDLTWVNPAQGANTAPIVGAELRVAGPNGYNETTYFAGTDRTSINNVAVPNVPGDYTATVYLRDAAGNETATNGSSVHLRFDDTVPVKSDPRIANGWLSRSELSAGYLQRWEAPTDQQAPPSGIAGYRVIVNRNSDTDPCSEASDQRACGGQITEAGINNTSRLLGVGDLIEGTNYVHVAPVSGSGMRATAIGHTPLKVDLTAPATVLQGAGDVGWLNHDVNLLAVGTDPLSGMQDTDEFPNDLSPATFIEVDGQLAFEPDANVARTVSSEGSHQIRYWARDLAGNESSANPGTATIRIDKSSPEVAFTNAQDTGDPDKLTAPVSDALSGVVDGRISYREAGGTEWKGLETVLKDGRLSARIDSADLRVDVTYEFRAVATDAAGNSGTSTNKLNGEPMRVTGPFRAVTGVVDLRVNGKTRAKVPYARKPKVGGALLIEGNGAPVAGAGVEIIETFAPGSKRKSRTRTILADNAGRFSTRLGRGPSRTIVARYAGDRRYLGTSSPAARVAVRSKVTLKVAPTAREGGVATFRGKVLADGARFGRAGKRLEIQVLVGKRWKAVGKSIRTNSEGFYELRYRFTADYVEPVRFEFRAVVFRERSFPYLAATSKRRVVVVSP